MLAMKRAGMNWAVLLSGIAVSGFVFSAQAQEDGVILGQDGTEYLITSAGRLPGEQTNPSLALGRQGGFVVWQDNVSDLDGLGISAQVLDAAFQPVGGEFCVNEIQQGDQENPRAAVFADGAGIFVWQTGVRGSQKIAYRVLGANGLWASEQSLPQNGLNQKDPQVAVLSNGTAVITWSAVDVSGKPMGVFMQAVSSTGAKLGSIQAVADGQGKRSSAITPLKDGGFAVAWLEENLSTAVSNSDYTMATITTSIKVQSFTADLTAANAARTVSPAGAIVSNPAIAAGPYGIAVAWSLLNASGSASQTWDVAGAVLDFSGNVQKNYSPLNDYTLGDQYMPQLTAVEENYFAVWTSLRQDGSFEGVFGRLFNVSEFTSDETRVNTTTLLKQLQPAVASSGNKLLVTWTSYLMGEYSFDLQAQRFITDSDGNLLAQPEKPFAYALTEYEIFVSWPAVTGRAVKQYDLFIDDLPALALKDNFYTLEDLDMSTTHTFKYCITLESGVVSPVSEPITVKTWGSDKSRDGLPDDWQSLYWGSDKSKWPGANEDSDGDGVSNLDEFLAGTNPMDKESALTTKLKMTAQGVRLEWNTVAGFVYQVQSSADTKSWTNLGAPRRAAGKVDSMVLDPAQKSFYRIIRMGGAQ